MAQHYCTLVMHQYIENIDISYQYIESYHVGRIIDFSISSRPISVLEGRFYTRHVGNKEFIVTTAVKSINRLRTVFIDQRHA